MSGLFSVQNVTTCWLVALASSLCGGYSEPRPWQGTGEDAQLKTGRGQLAVVEKTEYLE